MYEKEKARQTGHSGSVVAIQSMPRQRAQVERAHKRVPQKQDGGTRNVWWPQIGPEAQWVVVVQRERGQANVITQNVQVKKDQ